MVFWTVLASLALPLAPWSPAGAAAGSCEISTGGPSPGGPRPTPPILDCVNLLHPYGKPCLPRTGDFPDAGGEREIGPTTWTIEWEYCPSGTTPDADWEEQLWDCAEWTVNTTTTWGFSPPSSRIIVNVWPSSNSAFSLLSPGGGGNWMVLGGSTNTMNGPYKGSPPCGTIRHEYFHLIVNSHDRDLLQWVWFDEGAARWTQQQGNFNGIRAGGCHELSLNEFSRETCTYDFFAFWLYVEKENGGPAAIWEMLQSAKRLFKNFTDEEKQGNVGGPIVITDALSRLPGRHDAFEEARIDFCGEVYRLRHADPQEPVSIPESGVYEVAGASKPTALQYVSLPDGGSYDVRLTHDAGHDFLAHALRLDGDTLTATPIPAGGWTTVDLAGATKAAVCVLRTDATPPASEESWTLEVRPSA